MISRIGHPQKYDLYFKLQDLLVIGYDDSEITIQDEGGALSLLDVETRRPMLSLSWISSELLLVCHSEELVGVLCKKIKAMSTESTYNSEFIRRHC